MPRPQPPGPSPVIDPGVTPNALRKRGRAARSADGAPHCVGCLKPLTPNDHGPDPVYCLNPECQTRVSARNFREYRAAKKYRDIAYQQTRGTLTRAAYSAFIGSTVTRTPGGDVFVPVGVLADWRAQLLTLFAALDTDANRQAAKDTRRALTSRRPPAAHEVDALRLYEAARDLAHLLASDLR